MQTPMDAQSASQPLDNQLDSNADAHVPLETKETSTDKGAIKCSENSDKLINCGETDEHAPSIEHKGD